MPRKSSPSLARVAGALAVVTAAATLAGCGASHKLGDKGSHTASTNTTPLPGAGKPAVTIGDKNFTEQLVLGELYYEALRNQGFPVQLNQNIGPLNVTLRELQTGQLAMYPEYLNTWDGDVVHAHGPFRNRSAAYDTGQTFARSHGLKLLRPSPFSDTPSVGVTFTYAVQNGLRSVTDLHRL